MKGLLIKDFRLLSGQKKFFLVLLIVAVCFILTGQDAMFVIAYATMICTFFTSSTVSYDEFNNGNIFLFTLPFSRKEYVLEKYLFGMLNGGAAWLVTTIIGAAVTYYKAPDTQMVEWFFTVVIYISIMILLLTFSMPIELKFGAEKGRIANIAVLLIMFVVFMGVIEIVKKLNLDTSKAETILNGLGLPQIALLCVGVSLLLMLVSIAISNRIMEKKQF